MLSQVRTFSAAVVILLPAWVAGVPAESPRFVPLGPPSGPAADWITEHREGILAGAAGAAFRFDAGDPATRSERPLPVANVSRAVALGPDLLLVTGERQLAVLERGERFAEPMKLAPPARGRLTPVAVGDLLVVAEDAVGLRVMRIRTRHHHGAFELHPLGRLTLPRTWTALAAESRTVFAADSTGGLYEIDVSIPGSPRIAGRFAIDGRVDALAVNGARLFALGGGTLRVYDRSNGDPRLVELVSGVQGTALQLNGRLIHTAGAGGVQAWVDGTAGAQTHSVSLGNNFFAPSTLIVAEDDTVTWTNATVGGLHSVQSCGSNTVGCGSAVSTQDFSSGGIAGPVWTYSFQFTEPGPNPYVCLAHAFQGMAGVVHVGGIRVRPDQVFPNALPPSPGEVTPELRTGEIR